MNLKFILAIAVTALLLPVAGALAASVSTSGILASQAEPDSLAQKASCYIRHCRRGRCGPGYAQCKKVPGQKNPPKDTKRQ